MLDPAPSPGNGSTTAQATPISDRDRAEHVAHRPRRAAAGSGTCTLPPDWANANVASPGLANRPNSRMSIRPNRTNELAARYQRSG